jgi:hypothetical protein
MASIAGAEVEAGQADPGLVAQHPLDLQVFI